MLNKTSLYYCRTFEEMLLHPAIYEHEVNKLLKCNTQHNHILSINNSFFRTVSLSRPVKEVNKQTRAEEWKVHVSVNKVPVGKQTSNRARWIFHCGALLMRGSRGVLPRDCIVIRWTGPPSAAWLKEFGPMSYLSVIVRDGNPHLGYMNAAAHPSLG